MKKSISALAATLAMGVSASTLANQASQQALADSLVDAAAKHHARRDACDREVDELSRRIESTRNSVRSAEESLASTRASKPVLKDAWKRLAIGEFESEADFTRRQAAAKQREQRDFESAERDWKAGLSREEKRMEALRGELEVTTKRLLAEAESLKARSVASILVLPTLPSHRRALTSKEISLPRFDRESMSFGPIVIPPSGVTELRSSRPGNHVVRIEESSPATFRIMLPSLEAAKVFRERFEAGEIACVVVGGLDLSTARPESPILVRPKVTRIEETPDYVGGLVALAAALFAVGQGVDGQELQRRMDSLPPPSPRRNEVVVQPEVKEAGTRYHFAMSPDSVLFLDRSGGQVKDATVSFVGEFPRVKAISSDAQPAARALQRGDRIIRIGDRETRDIRAARSALRSFALGQSFEVVYRRAGSTKDLSFTAEGGRLLGIELE